MTANTFVYVTAIAAPREAVWRALTTAEFTRQYWHATRVESTWQQGAEVIFWVDEENGARVGCRGVIESVDEPHQLSYSWSFPANPDVADEAPSRVSFLLEDMGGHTKLTVVHDQFPDNSNMRPMITAGWPLVLSGLKTLLETGSSIDYSSLPDAG